MFVKKIKLSKLSSTVLVVIGVGILFASYQLGEQRGRLPGKTKDILNTVNFSSPRNEKNLEYFTGQIAFPSNYFATTDEMVTDYGSQGGMAPPRVILNKGSQVLANKGNDYSYMDFGNNDCILVWSTNGSSSPEEWGDTIGRFNGSLTNKESLNVGSRKVDLYKTTFKSHEKYIAYLPVGNKDRTSYFFESCNLNNKNDFKEIIKSIKFRPDLGY